MLGRIVFCVVLAAAVLAVVLLATVSPVPGRSHGKSPPGLRALTVYIHPAAPSGTVQQQHRHRHHQQRQGEPRQEEAAGALVFHHRVTAGPETTSRTVGAASGFALLLPPGERRGPAMSVFDMVHLAFDTAAGLSGSLCVETAAAEASGKSDKAPRPGHGEETLRVVGGTGSFAFVRGHAVLRRAAARGTTALRLDLSIATAE